VDLFCVATERHACCRDIISNQFCTSMETAKKRFWASSSNYRCHVSVCLAKYAAKQDKPLFGCHVTWSASGLFSRYGFHVKKCTACSAVRHPSCHHLPALPQAVRHLQLECPSFPLNSPLYPILTHGASLSSVHFNIIFRVSCRTLQTKLLCVFLCPFCPGLPSQEYRPKFLRPVMYYALSRNLAESDCQLLHVCLSARSSAWNSWAPFGRIVMIFDVWVVLENM
jgi:hypothetical protein